MPPPKDPIKREEWIKSRTGENNPFHRTKLSQDDIDRISKRNIGNKHRVGCHHSEESRKKIKKSNLGQKRSDKTRKRLSDSHSGIQCYNWKGGISFEPYCPKFNKEFKNRVRGFFGFKCVECELTQDQNGRLLDVHHVNYDKMMCCNDVKPLFVALCRSHNVMANFNRGYWENHYTDVINSKYGGACYLPKPGLSVEIVK